MPTPKFTRHKENFTCAFCGQEVKGTGYTNHCPRCLSSRHVDINPGDRAAACGKIMPAVSYELRGRDEYIIHKCPCGHTRPNKASPNDSRRALIALSNGTMDVYLKGLK